MVLPANKLTPSTKLGTGPYRSCSIWFRFYVYELLRPDGRVFYVGKGTRTHSGNDRGRLMSHLYYVRRGDTNHRSNVIRKIINSGGKIWFRVIFNTFDEQLAFDVECSTIAEYSDLTNKTMGGEGITGLRHSAEARAKMSAKRTGTRHSSEWCKAISDALRGKSFTDERRANISAAKKGKPRKPEHIRAAAAARVGLKRSMASIEKTSGECAGMAKLTWEFVDAIRARRKNGESLRDLAIAFGVSVATISKVAKYQSWAVKPSKQEI